MAVPKDLNCSTFCFGLFGGHFIWLLFWFDGFGLDRVTQERLRVVNGQTDVFLKNDDKEKIQNKTKIEFISPKFYLVWLAAIFVEAKIFIEIYRCLDSW